MEFIAHNLAPIMFAGLICFLLVGFPVAFSLGACGLFFAFIGIELNVLPEALPPVVIPWEAVRRASRMYIFRQPQKPGKSRAKAPASKPTASKGKADAANKPGKTKKSKSNGSEENL